MNAAVLAAGPLASILLFASCSSSPPSPPAEDTASATAPARAWIAPHAGCGIVHRGHGDAGGTPEGGPVADAGAGEASADDAAASADAGALVEAGEDGSSTGAADGAAGDDGGTWAYSACVVDADCVTAALVGCCHNGWLVAVNRGEVDAYEASFQCPEPRPICPLYQVLDTRIAVCDGATAHCTLVDAPDAQAGYTQ